MSGPEFDYRRLDDALHSRIRLAVMALLAGVESAEFTFVRDQVGATSGNLGTHMKVLREAGYVQEQKRFVGGKPNTRYRITGAGREALLAYFDTLQAMRPRRR